MSESNFNCYGVLWNKEFKFAGEFLRDINKNYCVKKIFELDISTYVYTFLKDIYPPELPEVYVKFKENCLNKINCKKVLVFTFDIPNPSFKFNSEEGQMYCLQSKNLKRNLRYKYIPVMNNYVEDNLSHFADNPYESKLVKSAIEKHKELLKDVTNDYLIEPEDEMGE